MPEFTGESSVVIAADRSDLRALRELAQRFFDIGSFRLAGAWRVNQIADEHNVLGLNLGAKAQQFVARSKICERTQLAAAALCPTIAEVQVGNQNGSCVGQPKSAAGMRQQAGKKRGEAQSAIIA